MDNHYVIEQMIRDRLAAARASARRTALIRQSKGRPRRSSGIGHRLIDLGRPLMKVARDAASVSRGFIGVVARSRLVHRLRELT